MSKGRYHAFSIVLPDAVLDDTESILKEAFKGYKAKKVSGSAKTEVFFDDAKIKALSDNTVDVYVRLYQVSQDVKVDAFFDLGGIFLNPRTHAAQSAIAEQILMDYATRYKRFQVETELKEQQKILTTKESEFSSLTKDKAKMDKSIASMERDIEKQRMAISANNMDQQRKRAEIESQKDMLVKMSGAVGKEKSVAEKTLKGLEKDLAKLQKEEEKLHSSIQDQVSKIEENKRNIQRNEADQKAKQSEVEQQKAVIKEVEERLAKIPRIK